MNSELRHKGYLKAKIDKYEVHCWWHVPEYGVIDIEDCDRKWDFQIINAYNYEIFTSREGEFNCARECVGYAVEVLLDIVP